MEPRAASIRFVASPARERSLKASKGRLKDACRLTCPLVGQCILSFCSNFGWHETIRSSSVNDASRGLAGTVTVLFRYDPQSLESARTALNIVTSSPTVLLYIGPDQIMPLTSVFAAVAGIVLMFWNRFVALFGRAWAILTRRASSSEVQKPTEVESRGSQH
jgi:hypothetical protein